MKKYMLFALLMGVLIAACAHATAAPTDTSVPPTATLAPTATPTIAPSQTPLPTLEINMGDKDTRHVAKGQPVVVVRGFVFIKEEDRNWFVENSSMRVSIDNAEPFVIADQNLYELVEYPTEPKFKYSCLWKWQLPSLAEGTHSVKFEVYATDSKKARHTYNLTIIVDP